MSTRSVSFAKNLTSERLSRSQKASSAMATFLYVVASGPSPVVKVYPLSEPR